MKKIFRRVSPLFLILVIGCGRGFNNQIAPEETALTFPTEPDLPEERTQIQGADGMYEIVRHSKAVVLGQVETKTENKQFTMRANLVVNGQSQGTVELSGEPNGDQAVLVPQQPELRDKYKAKVTCTSEDGTCSDYFVDFFARDGHTIYVDQYVKESNQKMTTTTTSTSTTSTSSTTTVKLPAVPRTQTTMPQVQKPSATKPQAPAFLKPKIPVLKPVDDSYDNQEEIDDDIPGEKDGGFVGTSDKDILDLFEKPKVETPQAMPTTVPPQKAPDRAIPVKPPVATPVPKQQEPQTKFQPKPVDPPAKVQPSPKPTAPEQHPQEIDQAINLPFRGSLRNGTNLLTLAQQEGFPLKIMWPAKKTYFATANMADMLKAMADFMQTKIKDYKLVLGDVSRARGGPILNKYGHAGHKGHQNGTDADISYVVKTPAKELNSLVNRGRLSRDLMLPEQWALMKFAFQTGQTSVIFVDPAIKHALCYEAQQEGDLKSSADRGAGYEVLRRVYTLPGHNTHFHLRIKCGDNNPRCRNQILTFGDSGCFSQKK